MSGTAKDRRISKHKLQNETPKFMLISTIRDEKDDGERAAGVNCRRVIPVTFIISVEWVLLLVVHCWRGLFG